MANELQRDEFRERQYFRQVWIGFLMILIDGVFVYFVGRDLFFSASGLTYASLLSYAMVLILFFIINWLMLRSHLDSKFDAEGIHIKFFPFHSRWEHYPWNGISKAEVVKVRPIRDFGGWGIRYAIGGGKVFNVQGNQAIKLQLKNGKLRYIGTQSPGKVKEVLAVFQPNAD